MRPRLLATLAVAALALVASARTDLPKALAWLHKVGPSLAPNVRADLPAVEAILHRYFEDRDSLRASEQEIAEAFLATVPSDEDIADRGSALDRMKGFESLMGGAKKTAMPPKPAAPKPRPPAGKRPIPGVHTRTVFAASSRSAPGGKRIGVVILGGKKTVVEILAASGGLDVARRAHVVASRMQALADRDRLWWATLGVRRVRGSYVVAPRAAGDFVITADPAFAKEWGLSPDRLAKQLVVKIRSAVDPEQGGGFSGRALSEDDLRLAAVDLRQRGDAAFASSPSGAESLYKQAIENDPGYAVPYLRLADLYLARHDVAGARAILQKGRGASDATGRPDIEAKLLKVK